MARATGNIPRPTAMNDYITIINSTNYHSMQPRNTHEATRRMVLREPYAGNRHVRFDEGQRENGHWLYASHPVSSLPTLLKITLLIKLICYNKALLVPICRRQQIKLVTRYLTCSCNTLQPKIKYSFSKSAFPALISS